MRHDPIAGALIALNASAGNGSGQWIQLIGAGPQRGRDGRGPFEVKDPQAVIRQSFAAVAGRMLPIDVNHSIDLAAAKGEASPAAGWVTRMEWRNNGLWGYAEWTPPAAISLQNKEYRFISPALAHDGNGTVLAVLRASLTNNPNLDLIALNAANGGTGKDAMDQDLLPELRKLLGLPDAADAVQAVAKLREALTSRNAVDPTKYVPIELFQQAVRELNERNNGMTKEDAEACVSVALQEQRLMPFMKDWAVDLCMRDRNAYETFIDGAGSKVHQFLGNLTRSPSLHTMRMQHAERERLNGGNGTAAVVADDINKTLGLSADDVKKFGGN